MQMSAHSLQSLCMLRGEMGRLEWMSQPTHGTIKFGRSGLGVELVAAFAKRWVLPLSYKI